MTLHGSCSTAPGRSPTATQRRDCPGARRAPGNPAHRPHSTRTGPELGSAPPPASIGPAGRRQVKRIESPTRAGETTGKPFPRQPQGSPDVSPTPPFVTPPGPPGQSQGQSQDQGQNQDQEPSGLRPEQGNHTQQRPKPELPENAPTEELTDTTSQHHATPVTHRTTA